MNNNLTTAKTLSNLNINENTLKEFHKKDLLEKGYCLIHLTDNEWRERSIDLEIVSKVIDDLTLKRVGKVAGIIEEKICKAVNIRRRGHKDSII